MRIILCAATPMEVAPVTDWLQTNWKPVEVLYTGVGLMAATFSLTKAVVHNRPDLIIGAGIAGSLDGSLALGQTVVISSEKVGDEGVMEEGRFRNLFDMKLAEINGRPWRDGKLVNTFAHSPAVDLPRVTGVTVNEITTDKERMAYYRNNLEAQVESMEGAALHYVALTEGIPFLQLRSISNYVGERDKTKWLIRPAVLSLNKALIQLLAQF